MISRAVFYGVVCFGVSAGAGISREIGVAGTSSDPVGLVGVGAFNESLDGQAPYTLASMESFVSYNEISVVAGTDDYQWYDPDTGHALGYEFGYAQVFVGFTLTDRRRVHSESSYSNGVNGYIVIEGPTDWGIGDWSGWLEPGRYTIDMYAEAGGGFSFVANIPSPAGAGLLAGGVLAGSCRRNRH
jgi:hypothetical protein